MVEYGRKFLLVIFAAFSSLLSAGAYDWPVSFSGMVSGFGQPDSRSFRNHVVLTAEEDAPVVSAASGELIYVRSELSDSRDLPSPWGNMCVMDHQGEFRTYYGSLKGIPDLHGPLKAFVGQTGRASGPGLFFALEDMKDPGFVNPLLLFPSVRDRIRPSIGDLYLVVRNRFITLDDDAVVLPVQADLVVEISDITSSFRSKGRASVPYHVEAYLNGEELVNCSFDMFRTDDEGLLLNGEEVWSDLFFLHEGEWFLKLGYRRWNPGDYRLEVLARDFAGNKRVRNISFRVADR